MIYTAAKIIAAAMAVKTITYSTVLWPFSFFTLLILSTSPPTFFGINVWYKK
jgi:hypothetical protein